MYSVQDIEKSGVVNSSRKKQHKYKGNLLRLRVFLTRDRIKRNILRFQLDRPDMLHAHCLPVDKTTEHMEN